MSNAWQKFLVVVALFSAPTSVYANECIVAFPEQNGSWATVEKGKFGGPLIRSADSVFDAASINVIHHPVDPWSNVLKKFEAGEIDILAVALRSREREKTMLFAGPWLSYRWGPFTLETTDADALKTPKIGVNRALKNVQPVPTYLSRLKGVPDWDTPANLLTKLTNGTVDMILGESGVINRQAQMQRVAVKEVPGTNMRMNAYMAIHPESTCASHVEALDRAIRQWKKNGGHERLLEAVAAQN